MTALSDPIVIGLMIFNIVMLLGYFSSKWLKACEPGAKKEHSCAQFAAPGMAKDRSSSLNCC